MARVAWMQRLRPLVMQMAGEEEGMGSQLFCTMVYFLSVGLYELFKALLSAHCRSVTHLNIDLCNHCRANTLLCAFITMHAVCPLEMSPQLFLILINRTCNKYLHVRQISLLTLPSLPVFRIYLLKWFCWV